MFFLITGKALNRAYGKVREDPRDQKKPTVSRFAQIVYIQRVHSFIFASVPVKSCKMITGVSSGIEIRKDV